MVSATGISKATRNMWGREKRSASEALAGAFGGESNDLDSQRTSTLHRWKKHAAKRYDSPATGSKRCVYPVDGVGCRRSPEQEMCRRRRIYRPCIRVLWWVRTTTPLCSAADLAERFFSFGDLEALYDAPSCTRIAASVRTVMLTVSGSASNAADLVQSRRERHS